MTEMGLIAAGLFVILSAAGVVFSRNPVYSAFCLVLAFLGLSAIYVLWESPFIAVIQVLVYTGAIVVLFVFVVMLLHMGKDEQSPVPWGVLLPALPIVWGMGLLVLRALNMASPPVFQDKGRLTLQAISLSLFVEYLWPFEILSVFLLAMVVAIYVLTRPQKGPS